MRPWPKVWRFLATAKTKSNMDSVRKRKGCVTKKMSNVPIHGEKWILRPKELSHVDDIYLQMFQMVY